MKAYSLILCCFVMVSIILSGCGSSELDPTTPSNPTTPTTPTTPNVPSESYFTWDCEAEHPAVGGCEPNTQIVTIDDAHSGNRCIQIHVIGNDNGNQQSGVGIRQAIRLGTIIDGRWYFYRWWMKLDEDFKWGEGTAKTKASRVKRLDENSPAPWTGYIGKNGFSLGEMAEGSQPWAPGGAMVEYDLQAMAGQGWHEYIVGIKTQTGADASDAIFQVYVDGELIGEDRNLHLTNQTVDCVEAWNGWMLRPYFQMGGTESDGGLLWLDDFSMDNDWNSSSYQKP